MKKIILVALVVFTLAITTSSCKKDKTEVKKEMTTKIYQCPMDCEKGKSYTEPGNCPVCKMALKPLKASSKDHSNHQH